MLGHLATPSSQHSKSSRQHQQQHNPADHPPKAKDSPATRSSSTALSLEKLYVTGEQILKLLEQYGLSGEEIAIIWVRADEVMNGRLDLEEFCNAMWLVGQKRSARSG